MENVFNPFPNKPRFLHVCSTKLLKTLWEKEKLLVTVFSTHMENFVAFLSNFNLSSANSLILEESKLLLYGKELSQRFLSYLPIGLANQKFLYF